MQYIFYENYGKIEDNGFWNLAQVVSDWQIIESIEAGDIRRAFIKSDIIYVVPYGVEQAITYKLKLSDYAPKLIDNLIDILTPILE